MESNTLPSDNELIAQFMGFSEKHIQKCDISFDKSWDMLMPVVEKIESLGLCTTLNYHPDTKVKYFSIYDSEYRNTAKGKQFYAEGKDCVYKSVVQFIKWYNQQPKL